MKNPKNLAVRWRRGQPLRKRFKLACTIEARLSALKMQKMPVYNASANKPHLGPAKLSNRRALLQPYDPSAVIRSQFTIPARSNPQNPCDPNFAESTLNKSP
jgi:hypothetical protein